jgi:homogentisate 1,2-dioxygenase
MAFMFETRHVVRLTQWAIHNELAQRDYDAVWAGFAKARLPR